MTDSKLWEALDLVRKGQRLAKGTRDDRRGGHCALGFLEVAYFGVAFHPQFPMANDGSPLAKDREVLGTVLMELFPERCSSIWADGWVGHTVASINNHPDTTLGDLELAFEKAAIRRDEVLSD
jgi:hypothetical protein